MHSDDSKLTLADRTLIFMGKLAARSDIKIEQHSKWSDSVKKWESILPEDMYAFYKERNGLIFHYKVKGSSTTGSLYLLGLQGNGRGVVEPTPEYRGITMNPYQMASAYGEYFLDESSTIGPDDKVLFWFGDMAGWGILMVGEGESSTFYTWDNDGFTKPMSTMTFTDIMERGLSRGFVHTWQYDEHPLLEETLAPLQIENPPLRTPVRVSIEAVHACNASEWRAHLVSTFQKIHKGTLLLELLGLEKKASLEEQVEAFETYCTQPLKEIKAADVKALTKACTKKTSKKAFVEYFKVGQEFDWEKIDLRFEIAGVKKGADLSNDFLFRVFASIEDLRPFVDSFEGHIDVLRYTYAESVTSYWPFLLHASLAEEAKGVFTTSWVREGHSDLEPATYTSDALLSTSDLSKYSK